MALIETGSSATGTANVDVNFNLHANLPGYSSAGVIRGGGEANAGFATMTSEIDNGEVIGTRDVASPETDSDFRLRVALDNVLDYENFNYTAQNTGKFFYNNATMTLANTATGLQTNSASITTTGTGATFGSFGMYPRYSAPFSFAQLKISRNATRP